MSLRNTLSLVLIAIVIGVLCAPTLGQGVNGRLDGVVKDQTGAVIPGATVMLTNQANNLTVETLSTDSGVFIFVNLVPGSYTLAAELTGFKRYVQPDIRITVGGTLSLDAVLETGDITEEVTIISSSVKVDQTSQKIGSVVTTEEIVNLPLLNRDVMNLFYSQAGANRANAGFAGGRTDGLRSTQNNVKIEGVDNSVALVMPGASFSPAPLIPEAMAEYSIVNSSASADEGSGSGAQVSLVYKSGTNEFHGSVWTFYRSNALAANNFFNNRQGIDKPFLNQFQYGFAVGGPIWKDKAFFHVSWENWTIREASTTQRTVWTDRFKNTGVFQYESIVDGSTKEIDLASIDPTRTGINSIFTQFANLLPSPNNNDSGDGFNTAGYRYSSSDPRDEWKIIVKGDYVFNQNHRLGLSFGQKQETDPSSFHILGHPNSLNNETYPTGVVSLTSSFSPILVNELRMGATSRKPEFNNGDPARFTTIPLLNFNSLGARSRGGNANRSNFLPQFFPTATITLNDSLSWIKGDHTLKFGFEIKKHNNNTAFGGDFYLPVSDTSNGSNPATILGLGDIDPDDLTRAQQATNDITASLGQNLWTFQQIVPDGSAFVPFETKRREWRAWQWSAFVQDTWKARPNLTVNMGLRYEVLPSAYENQGIFSYPVSGGEACVQCVRGISGPGETQLGPLPDAGRELFGTDLNNFGPNLGLTWDPWGDGKWSLAANYRIAYDRTELTTTLFQDFSQEGASTSVTTFGQPGQRLDFFPTVDPGTPFGPKPFNRQGTVTVWNDDWAIPYVQSWSARVQHEIMRDTVVEVAYVGNHGVGLQRTHNLNIFRRHTDWLNGAIVARQNLAQNGDPLVGGDTGVFGQIWSVMSPGDQSSQLADLGRGELGDIADFIDRSRSSSMYLEAAGLPLTFFRDNPQFQNAYILGNVSHSTYNGLKIDVRRRFSDGLQFQANYAFAKSISDYEGGQSQRNNFRDPRNYGLDKTRSSIDARHIINANTIYELPFGIGRRYGADLNPWLDGVLGGWQVNAIVAYSTGQPRTIDGRNSVNQGDDSTVTFLGSDSSVTSKVVRGEDNITFGADTSNFAHAPAGSAGLTAQRFFNDASFWVLDASVFKDFRAPWFRGENSAIQFRFEFFNATNSTRFNNFNDNFLSSSFGNITSSRDARIMQVALKFIF